MERVDWDGLRSLIFQDDIPAVTSLLKLQGVIALRGPCGISLLHSTCLGTQRTRMAQLFLDHGLDVNAVDSYGFTPLLYAISNGHVKICRLLLMNGATVQDKYYGYGDLSNYVRHCYPIQLLMLQVRRGRLALPGEMIRLVKSFLLGY